MGPSTRIAILTFLVGILLPCAAFAQNQPLWLDLSPGVVYQPPGDPSCYTVTVGGGANMTVDVEYYFQGSGPQYAYGWLTLDANGQAQICMDGSSPEGEYVITGVRNSEYYWGGFVPVYVVIDLLPASLNSPVVDGLGPGCDNWDCIWIVGERFRPDSYVYIYAADWSAYQVLWGPAWGQSPVMWVAPDGTTMTFYLTEPTVLRSFGNAGVYILVVNADGSTSPWVWTQSPPPVVTSGGTGCNGGYCIWLTGSFPLNAVVDLRVPGQSDSLPNAYSDLHVSPSMLTFQLNSGVRPAFDSSGLDVWAVNAPLANWSNGYYVPTVDHAITGNIDGVVQYGQQHYVNGWACAKADAGSVDVQMFVGGPAGSGTFASNGTANLDSEPAVAAACNATGSHFRFSLLIPNSMTQAHSGEPIYIHGISPYGLANSLIGNSGTFTVPAVDLSVTGWISSVVLENSQYDLRGWACAKTFSGSIDVHLYAGGPAGSGSFVTAVTANQPSEPAIAASCNSKGTQYGFSIPLTLAIRQQFGGQTIFVHGISPFGMANSLLNNSGNLTIPSPVGSSVKEYIYIGDRVLAVDITNLP